MRIPVKSNDVKLPFHTIPVGIVFKDEVCVTVSFHQTEMLTDFVTYSKKEYRYQRQLRFGLTTTISLYGI
jgi:magnesium transporter